MVTVTNSWYCLRNMNAQKQRIIGSAIAYIFDIFCSVVISK
ncbi:MAG: hypothetical protein V7K88_02050 [Nostoc sp.]